MSFKSGFESRESQFYRAGGSEFQVKYWPRNRCSQSSGWDWRRASGKVRTGGSMFWSWTRRMRHCQRTGGNSWSGPSSRWPRRHRQSRSTLPVWKTGERRRRARCSSLGIEPPSPATSVPVPEINIPPWNWPSCCLSALKSLTVIASCSFANLCAMWRCLTTSCLHDSKRTGVRPHYGLWLADSSSDVCRSLLCSHAIVSSNAAC